MHDCRALSSDAAALPYDFALLAPGGDRPTFDGNLLGIEVTDPMLAKTCGLGNIDPQHAPGATARAPAAIEACLDTPLPPLGSCLATIRPDLDAVGAMALLCLRAKGQTIDRAVRDRVARIAALDRFDRGPWPGPRPLPLTTAELANDWPGTDLTLLGAFIRDSFWPLAERVAAVIRWLESGDCPDNHRETLKEPNLRLLRSLQSGATQIQSAPCGRFATVRSQLPAALSLGYRLAPVTVALNSLFRFPDGRRGRKYTISRWSDDDANLDEVIRAISALESGWGGQRGIKGSPQNRPSTLSYREVCQLVSKALDR